MICLYRTAPHVVDPKNPGAVDEIINLGEYWNEAGMRKNREEITSTNKEVGKLFARAYKYLKAASCIYEDSAEIYSRAMDEAKVSKLANVLLFELFGSMQTADRLGKERRLFATAITPDGLKTHLDSLLTTEKVYSISSVPAVNSGRLLEKIRDAALEKGLNVEGYYCALYPEKLEHLIIPGMGISFTSENQYHMAGVPIYRELDLIGFLDKGVLNANENVLGYDQSVFDELLQSAVDTIAQAKKMHDLMEKYYIPNMDFDAIQRCWESTMGRIMEYAGAKVLN